MDIKRLTILLSLIFIIILSIVKCPFPTHEEKIWYLDIDNDGLGDSSVYIRAKKQPQGYVSNKLDKCPDKFGKKENQGCPSNDNIKKWYFDKDGDGLGDPEKDTLSIEKVPNYVDNNLDRCPNKYGAKRNHGCPLNIPPNKTKWFKDQDRDNLGDPAIYILAIDKPEGYVKNNLDKCPNEYGNITNNGCPQSNELKIWYKDIDSDGLGDHEDFVKKHTRPVGYVSNNSDQCPDRKGLINNFGCPEIKVDFGNSLELLKDSLKIPIKINFNSKENDICKSNIINNNSAKININDYKGYMTVYYPGIYKLKISIQNQIDGFSRHKIVEIPVRVSKNKLEYELMNIAQYGNDVKNKTSALVRRKEKSINFLKKSIFSDSITLKKDLRNKIIYGGFFKSFLNDLLTFKRKGSGLRIKNIIIKNIVFDKTNGKIKSFTYKKEK